MCRSALKLNFTLIPKSIVISPPKMLNEFFDLSLLSVAAFSMSGGNISRRLLCGRKAMMSYIWKM
jgi:hypothetical protein